MTRAINLLPASRRLRRRAGARRRAWGVGLVAYAALIGVGALAVSRGPASSAASGPAAAEASARVEAARAGREAAAQSLTAAEARLEAARRLGGHPDWSVLLALLASRRGEQVVLERLAAEQVAGAQATARGAATPARPAGVRLRVEGAAVSPAAVTDYLLDLERSGVFDSVRLIETSPRPLGERTLTGFRLEAAWARGGPTAQERSAR